MLNSRLVLSSVYLLCIISIHSRELYSVLVTHVTESARDATRTSITTALLKLFQCAVNCTAPAETRLVILLIVLFHFFITHNKPPDQWLCCVQR